MESSTKNSHLVSTAQLDFATELCHKCGQRFENSLTSDEILNIIVKNSSMDKNPCESCLGRLMKQKSENGLLLCSMCQYSCRFQSDFARHIIRIHIQPKLAVRKCKACGMNCEGYSPQMLLNKIITSSAESDKPCKSCVKILVKLTTKNGSLVCFICTKRCCNINGVSKHIVAVHIPVRPYSCDQCGKKFKTLGNLKSHAKSHETNRNTKCTTCGKYISKEYLDCHKQQRHCDKPVKYICSVCGEEHTNTRSFRYHMEKHENKVHKCTMCEKTFNTKKSILQHVQRFHLRKQLNTPRKRLKCDKCQKYFSGARSLNIHILCHHSTDREKVAAKKFRCETCGVGYLFHGQLNTHMRTHSGIKPYKCDVCGKCFVKKGVLNRHQLIHAAEKKYKCDTCGASFNQKYVLTRHQFVHTGEKPFECGICGQRFTQKQYMKEHERKH